MRNEDKTVGDIDTDNLVELIETCQAEDNLPGILRAASRLIEVAFHTHTVAFTLLRPKETCEVYMSSLKEIGSDAERLVRAELSNLLCEAHRLNIAADALELIPLQRHDPQAGQIDLPKILWSVDIGPSGQKMGSLAVFGSDRTRLNDRILLGLRAIGRVIGTVLTQSVSSPALTQSENTPNLIEFRIHHIEAIREAFGPHRTNRLKVEIAQRIVETLPRGAAVARIQDNGITAIISDPSLDLSQIQAQCLQACRGLEIDERILVKIESYAAVSALAHQTQVAAMTVSQPVTEHSLSVARGHTH